MLKKNLKFWPVICLVGSRQVGKSTLVKTLSKFRYFTFDDPGFAALAEQNPSQILEPPCVFDEAQKVPKIFDAVKLNVDQEKRPGKFILTGSVRFSRRTLIRESLTGRSKTLQLYPLTCAESFALPFENRWNLSNSVKRLELKPRVSRKDFYRFLSNGSMPAIFAARNTSERVSYWNSLIESYIYRDLLLTIPKNAKPSVALAILRAIAETLALGEMPTFSRILKKAGGTRASIEKHLQGLEDLMIIHRLGHLSASTAKDIFMPFDSAFFLALLRLETPLHDSAVHLACLQIAFINEILAHHQYSDTGIELKYAVSPTGEIVHFSFQNQGQNHGQSQNQGNKNCFWKLSAEPVPSDYSLRFLRALSEKYQGSASVLSSTEKSFDSRGVQVVPYEVMI